MTTQFENIEYLTAAQVRERFAGASRMWIHRRLKSDGFPPPVYFGGRLRYWRAADVAAWERSMIERGVSAPKPPQQIARNKKARAA